MEIVDDLACRDLVGVVTDYLDGVLPVGERARFELHIAGCDACRVYVEQVRQTIAAARATRDEAPSLEVSPSLLAAFRAWRDGDTVAAPGRDHAMTAEAVERHYARGDLRAAVLAALVEAGHDPDALDPEALAPMEELHTLGRAATLALADAAAVTSGDRVLDVGSGLGGPARLLARRYGCAVVGVDLTEEFCDLGRELTRRVGLDGRVELLHADALDLPFPDGAFDVAWTQHVSMNIADKARLFAEMRRVLRPGGRLAFFDILAGPVQPIHFPVPWAGDASVSFLATPDETRRLVIGAGFTVRVWDDVTPQAVAFFAGLDAAPTGASPLGLHLLLPDLRTKAANLRRNAEEQRIAIVRCVADA